jgi:protein tyrosine phosphatase (PTP) superfamily phosphohydrolase (DUF442 family)
MTKNGLRLPCYCRKCKGDSKDYRTVADHADRAIADRPLFRGPIDVRPNVDDQKQPEDAHVQQPADAVVQPYPEGVVDDEDIVSHAEAMPNCHKPLYASVRPNVSVFMHYFLFSTLYANYSPHI